MTKLKTLNDINRRGKEISSNGLSSTVMLIGFLVLIGFVALIITIGLFRVTDGFGACDELEGTCKYYKCSAEEVSITFSQELTNLKKYELCLMEEEND